MLKRAGIQTVKQCRHGKTKPRLQHKTGLNGQNGSGTYQSMAVECGQGTPRIGSTQCHWVGLVRFTVVGPVTSLIWNFNIFYEGRVTGCDVDLVGGEGRGRGGEAQVQTSGVEKKVAAASNPCRTSQRVSPCNSKPNSHAPGRAAACCSSSSCTLGAAKAAGTCFATQQGNWLPLPAFRNRLGGRKRKETGEST